MGLLLKFARLEHRKRGLVAPAVLWIVVSRIALRVLPFRTVSALLERIPWPIPRPCSPEDVLWALHAAARRIPGTRCLAWALACRGLLQRAGIPSRVRIGVAKERGRRLVAHAWVECSDFTASWGDDERIYVPLPPVLGGDV